MLFSLIMSWTSLLADKVKRFPFSSFGLRYIQTWQHLITVIPILMYNVYKVCKPSFICLSA